MANLELVKQLRESTGCGIADCNKALAECDNNLENATDWLRKKGLTKAAKKGDRIASEGLVGIASDTQAAALVEINSETDFVARNEIFQNFVTTVSKIALEKQGELRDILNSVYPGSNATVEGETQNKIGVIGEKISIRRAAYVGLDGEGVIGTYVHNKVADNMGKIGVIVALKSTGDKTVLAELAKNLAMHIAASKPEYLRIADVDAADVEREKAIYREQMLSSGTKAELVDKIVEGKIGSYYKTVVLPEQVFVMDGKKSVKEIVADTAKTAGAAIEITDFKLFVLGEGIEKKENDFAAEVSSIAGK